MEIEINNVRFSVIIIRKKNKNTYIRINDKKEIVISTSTKTTEKEIIRIINENMSKIERMLNSKRVVESENVLYLNGLKYDIIVISNHKDILIDGSKIYGPSFKKIMIWYEDMIYNQFKVLLDKNYYKFEEKIPYPLLKVRKMKSRWGVCNRKEITVTLNSHLMKYNEDIIEYVIIHELAHFVYFDHSKRFWNVVEFYCPNYKQRRKELKN